MMDKTKLKAIAVDDELHCIETLSWELERNCPEVELVEKITKEDNARSIIPDADIDILFMDIHLQTTSGIELVKELQPLDCEVIFITAYDQYAIQAFEVDAIHYLLKPINGSKLRLAIDRIMAKRTESDSVAVQKILTAMSSSLSRMHRVPFNVQSGIEFILPDDIVYVSGDSNYSVLHFTSGEKLMISKTLKSVEILLSEYTFLRIHKSYLLNLNHIERYVKTDGGYIQVKGGDQLSVSRTKRATINELFKNI